MPVRCPACKAIAIEESRNYTQITYRCSCDNCQTLFRIPYKARVF